MNFPEELLHFIWRFRLYQTSALYTTDGEKVEVLHPGTLNFNSGPDFIAAKLQIADTFWVGNIEIHLRSSDWILHQHQFDEAYDSVILHVVYANDKDISRSNGSSIPVLELQNKFDEGYVQNYHDLIRSSHNFPCEKQIHLIDPLIIYALLDRLGIERLVKKSTEILLTLKTLKGNWNETFYRLIAKSLGMKQNSTPMELLTSSLPHTILDRHQDNSVQIEALLFGQAGFLNQSFNHSYPIALKKEYQFLKHKYKLTPISISLWKFMRMRPQNFPTLRLAQLSALLSRSSKLFSSLIAATEFSSLKAYFTQLTVHPFWNNHFHFNKTATNVNPQLGDATIHHIIVNTISPILFAYGQYINQERYKERATTILEWLSPETNSIVKRYENAGVRISSALHSQGLIRLKKECCDKKQCLICPIGLKLLRAKEPISSHH